MSSQTSSYMEPHQTFPDLINGEPSIHDQHDEILPQPSIGAVYPPTTRTKRRYWMVQVRNNEGRINESSMTVKEIYSLPFGEKIVSPFEGNHPSGVDADGLLRGFWVDWHKITSCFPFVLRTGIWCLVTIGIKCGMRSLSASAGNSPILVSSYRCSRRKFASFSSNSSSTLKLNFTCALLPQVKVEFA
ncbi:hypothetical protein E2542_SST26825 [Spatholobus suberectus]|nr:hypothetical protein E2542_SST26825 [Spatholobus suberectus]